MAINAFTKFSGKSLNPTGVLFLNAYLPNVTPSDEITSVARFFSGFSNSSNVGSSPKIPQEANKNTNKIEVKPPNTIIQNRLIYFLKFVSFFFAMLVYFFNSKANIRDSM